MFTAIFFVIGLVIAFIVVYPFKVVVTIALKINKKKQEKLEEKLKIEWSYIEIRLNEISKMGYETQAKMERGAFLTKANVKRKTLKSVATILRILQMILNALFLLITTYTAGAGFIITALIIAGLMSGNIAGVYQYYADTVLKDAGKIKDGVLEEKDSKDGKNGKGSKDGKGTTDKKGDYPNTSVEAFVYLKDAGYSDIGASAFIGNFMQEAGNQTYDLDPNIGVREGEASWGIAQWTSTRKATLLGKKEPDTIKTQVAFVVEEMEGYTRLNKALKSEDDIAQLGILTERINNEYEVSSDNTGVRGEFAAKFYKEWVETGKYKK